MLFDPPCCYYPYHHRILFFIGKMISRILLGGAIFVRLVSPVAAVPQFVGRDEHCTATITVHSSIDESDLAQSTTTLAPTDDEDLYWPAKTVTVFGTLTVTITSTNYAPAVYDGQQTTDSPKSSGPQTVTVTVTNVLTSVQTQTVVQTQTITQDRTVLQTHTVTQTLVQADNVKTANDEDLAHTASTPVSNSGAVKEPRPRSTSVIAVLPQATNSPYYGNSTSATASSSASSATAYLNASLNASYSSNYQNGLYFTNWYAPFTSSRINVSD